MDKQFQNKCNQVKLHVLTAREKNALPTSSFSFRCWSSLYVLQGMYWVILSLSTIFDPAGDSDSVALN